MFDRIYGTFGETLFILMQIKSDHCDAIYVKGTDWNFEIIMK